MHRYILKRIAMLLLVILILGMMASSGVSAIVQILQYMSNEEALKSFVIWTMGSLGDVTTSELALVAPVIISGLIISVAVIKPLNLLLLGEDSSMIPAKELEYCIRESLENLRLGQVFTSFNCNCEGKLPLVCRACRNWMWERVRMCWTDVKNQRHCGGCCEVYVRQRWQWTNCTALMIALL